MPDAALGRAILAALRDWASGAVPPGIAQMRLIMLVPGDRPDLGLLGAAIAAGKVDPREASVLSELAARAVADPEAWARVRATAGAIPHDEAVQGAPAEAVQRLATRFDAAARVSPEASVALYSLGDPVRLAAATAEIVAWLQGHDLLGAQRRVLDLGCGIGRLALAIAPSVQRVVGCDISDEMLRVARCRAADTPNAEFRRTDGLDLALFAPGTFDLVLAADVFPYLVAAGGDLASRHVAEAARVLKPGGALVILNLSYRGAPERDAADLMAWASQAGLRITESGAKPFREWDAHAFRLAKV